MGIQQQQKAGTLQLFLGIDGSCTFEYNSMFFLNTSSFRTKCPCFIVSPCTQCHSLYVICYLCSAVTHLLEKSQLSGARQGHSFKRHYLQHNKVLITILQIMKISSLHCFRTLESIIFSSLKHRKTVCSSPNSLWNDGSEAAQIALMTEQN